jgi:hypothetical protein
MSTGTFDLTNTQPARAYALGIPLDALAVYCGISETHLRGLLNGRRTSNEQMLLIRGRLNELESLKRLCWPVPIDFKDVQAVAMLLDRLRDGKTEIHILNSEPSPAETFEHVEIPGIRNEAGARVLGVAGENGNAGR